MTALDSITGSHPSDWRVVPLGTVCEITVGPSGLKKMPSVDDGVPVISPDNLVGGRIVLGRAVRIDAGQADRYPDYRVRPMDLVLARKRNRHPHSLAGSESEGAVVDGSCILLRTKNDLLGEYLHHYLIHPAVQAWLASRSHRGLITNMRQGTLRELPALIPPVAQQREIASLFRALDEKIRVHEQVAEVSRALRGRLIEPLLAVGLDDHDHST
jgi:hypothetical protein